MNADAPRFEDPPDSLDCRECGTAIETGYVAALAAGDRYRPLADRAVCDACGFSAVGFAGCAPELGDLAGAGEADALVRVEVEAETDVEPAGTVTATMVTDRS